MKEIIQQIKRVVVAIYIRVSTLYQVDKASLPVQRKELIAYAELVLGATEYKIFEDAGYSAKNTDRPAYQEMMGDVRSGYYTHILVWKIDRISRNLLDFSMMYSELNDLGVTFVSKNEQFDTSTAIGEAMLKIILVFAELERNMTSERVAAVMVSRANDGIWNGGNIPYGYTYNKELKMFYTEPEEAKAVDLIYYYYEQTRSLTKVCSEMNRHGYRTRRGGMWNPVSAHIILRNPFYIGTYRYNYYKDPFKKTFKDESEWVVIRDHHPAIINENRFDRVNKMLDENAAKRNMKGMTKNRGNVHVFQGLLRCGYCGSTMTCTTKKFANGFRSSSYLCPTKRKDGDVKCRHTSDVVVGSFVLNFVVNMLTAQRKASEIADKQALSKLLLDGKDFNPVVCISDQSLTELMDAIVNSRRRKLSLKPRSIEGKSELSRAKSEVNKVSRAIDRLKTLYLYDESGMSQQEYLTEKRILDDKLVTATERLNKLTAVENPDRILTDEDLMKKASAFAFQKKLTGGKYINYRKMMSSIDGKVVYDFVHSIIDHITMKYSYIKSITFLNGVTVTFLYKEDSDISQ